MTGHPRDHEVDELEAEERDDTVIGVVFWRSLMVMIVVAVAVGSWIYLQRKEKTEAEVVERGETPLPAKLEQGEPPPHLRFTDVTDTSGIDFVHVNGANGEKLLPETMGSGLACFDYDGDGDQDLYFANATHWPWSPDRNTTKGALYVNRGDGTFENATERAGLIHSGYETGVAVGDIDQDVDIDLFIASLGSNKLFRNDNGRFVDVTKPAGVAGESDRWSTSAGFADLDNDGDLDLFVCNYVAWTKEIDLDLNFSINGTDRAYGPPTNYRGTFSYLYENLGNGTFRDVSQTWGVQVTNPATGEPLGKALAVAFADADRDGRMDIFVANDTVQNFAFRNMGGRFEEVGSQSGLAFDQMGSSTGAMGMDIGDFRNRGDLAVSVANFANESTSFYVQQSTNPWLFNDISNATGIGSPSRLKLSFGLFFFDVDLDGRLDLFQSNGHLETEINEIQPSQHYRQPAQLFWNRLFDGQTEFVEIASEALGDLSKPIVGRGSAYADFDGDGDLDVVMTQSGGPPLFLRNDLDNGHHWLRVKLKGTTDNRFGIGAWIELKAGEETQRRQVMPTRSYLSQVELPVTFGLGSTGTVDSLVVQWPNGTRQEVAVDGVDTTIEVTQESR